MPITCYFVSGSPFAWRVMLALGYKGLDYEPRMLEASKGETKSPDYLAINPRGKVPALVDGDVTVTESLAILAYLDRAYPEKPLFGTSAAEAARVWQRIFEADNYFGEPARHLLTALFTGKVAGREAELAGHAAAVGAELATFEGWLGAGDYLAGNAVSALDIALYPPLAIADRLLANAPAAGLPLGFLPLDQHYPRLTAWMKRMEGIEGYEAAYPPHWRKAA